MWGQTFYNNKIHVLKFIVVEIPMPFGGTFQPRWHTTHMHECLKPEIKDRTGMVLCTCPKKLKCGQNFSVKAEEDSKHFILKPHQYSFVTAPSLFCSLPRTQKRK